MNQLGDGRRGVDADDDLSRFAEVDTWVFDLDDTLYAITPELGAIFDGRMRTFIMDALELEEAAARKVQKDLFDRHGATGRGLMIEHGISADDFLAFVHDVDHSTIAPNPALVDAIGRLPGRCFVLTNSPRSHAERVLRQLGAETHFEEIFDFARSGRHSKPHPDAYERIVRETGLTSHRTAIFEDMARNLVEPQRLGMTTVLVVPPKTRPIFRGDWDLEAGPHHAVDYITEDLAGFLTAALAEIASAN